MVESFYLLANPELVERAWKQKNLLSASILGREAHRQLRPDVIKDRTRLDIMSLDSRLGIRGPQKEEGGSGTQAQSNNFDFHELEAPDTVHPGILLMMEELRHNPLPEKMAQLRLRYHPETKAKGLWIDISNESIKRLLDSGDWLRSFLKRGWFLELGQKGKEVHAMENQSLSFQPASARRWLDSYSMHNEAIPLCSKIAHFSQPGPEANRALLVAAFDLIDACEVSARNFVEFGAGYGNLTAAFASRFSGSSWSSEFDADMTDALLLNKEEFFPQVEIVHSRAASKVVDLGKYDLCLIDPPRPGFPDLFKDLLREGPRLPKYFLAYHCHHRGLLSDSEALKKLSYQLQAWTSIDVFPATPHHEVVSLWERS